MRSLIEFSETLDELPKSCWITLVLEYTDSTPADYEPEFFKVTLSLYLLRLLLPSPLPLSLPLRLPLPPYPYP